MIKVCFHNECFGVWISSLTDFMQTFERIGFKFKDVIDIDEISHKFRKYKDHHLPGEDHWTVMVTLILTLTLTPDPGLTLAWSFHLTLLLQEKLMYFNILHRISFHFTICIFSNEVYTRYESRSAIIWLHNTFFYLPTLVKTLKLETFEYVFHNKYHTSNYY